MDATQARQELTGGAMGVMGGLRNVTDADLVALHGKVSERGSDLWNRFTAWRDEANTPARAGFPAWVQHVLAQSEPDQQNLPPQGSGFNTLAMALGDALSN